MKYEKTFLRGSVTVPRSINSLFDCLNIMKNVLLFTGSPVITINYQGKQPPQK